MLTPQAAIQDSWQLSDDGAPLGMALAALDGRFIRVNTRLCTMVGRSREELLAMRVHDLTHPDDLEADLVQTQQLARGEITSFRMRKRYLHQRGHHVWVDLSVALVRDSRGAPSHTIGYAIDLTEQVEATQRLEQSNADLQAFATLVSHDLQAPLSTVHGYLQLLQEEYADQLDSQGQEWIRRVDAAARRMSGLVQSMLALSRTEAALCREPVSVADLVVEVCADLDSLVAEHGAVIEVAEEQLMVVADPARLRQVLQNLLQNALKHRHPDRAPEVLVTVAECPAGDDAWLVTVDDNGRGIAPDRRESVFELFTRLDEHTEGHGVGLAACRRIVERHGGRIWVEDAPHGPGSRFALTLPY